jgi:hypothetical protein
LEDPSQPPAEYESRQITDSQRKRPRLSDSVRLVVCLATGAAPAIAGEFFHGSVNGNGGATPPLRDAIPKPRDLATAEFTTIMLKFGRSRSPSPPPRKMTELEAPFATAHATLLEELSERLVRTKRTDRLAMAGRPTRRFSPSARLASPIRSRSRGLPILAHGRGFPAIMQRHGLATRLVRATTVSLRCIRILTAMAVPIRRARQAPARD